MSTIIVEGHEINIEKQNDGDYINLTQMVAHINDGTKIIERWLNSKTTVDFLGVWESLYNKNFKTPEFRGIRENAGTPSYYLSVKKWIETTNAIGVTAKSGRYGGTYAHKDIAFEFASYVSPMFKLMLIKEFQRLKDEEHKKLGSQWDFRRYVSKVNYKIQTDTIKAVLVPIKNVSKEQERFIYAEEADLIYLAMFGVTSKQWREKFPEHAANGLNIRDIANTHQLIVLSNLESANSLLMNGGYLDAKERLIILRKQSILELKSLQSSNQLEHELVISPNSLQHPNNQKNENLSDFNQKLNQALKFKPKDKDKDDKKDEGENNPKS